MQGSPRLDESRRDARHPTCGLPCVTLLPLLLADHGRVARCTKWLSASRDHRVKEISADAPVTSQRRIHNSTWSGIERKLSLSVAYVDAIQMSREGQVFVRS